ncbi:MAG: hypothetical protein AAF456_10935, partial [Planctomycetota bacterium]
HTVEIDGTRFTSEDLDQIQTGRRLWEMTSQQLKEKTSEPAMPDGKRRRRHSENPARRRWYAQHRARRFATRLWNVAQEAA